MTKFLTKAALAATALTALVATPATAANTDSENFTANATIVKPLSLVNNRPLEFGTITMRPGLTTTTVRVRQTGVLASDCDAAVVTCTGTRQAATFTVTGVGNESLNVTLGAVTQLLSGSDSVAFSADAPGVIQLNAGTVDFSIGGAVTVTSATRDGAYTADVPVTVTYQ